MRGTHGTYEGIGKIANKTDDFESTDPSTIDTALLSHLISIDNSWSLHIDESQQTMNQCLQEARLHGLFEHEDTLTECSDKLGILVDDNVYTQEHDWLHEYEQRKQMWKSSVIHDQDHSLPNQQEAGENIVSSLDNLPTSEDVTVNH
jgi:hypothetical protein